MFEESLFALVGLSVVVLLLRLIFRQKGQFTLVQSLHYGFIILIVIVMLMLIFKP